MAIAGWLLVLRIRRRRWLHTLERWGPERCSVGTAATIVGTDAQTLAHALELILHQPVAPNTLLSKGEILEALSR